MYSPLFELAEAALKREGQVRARIQAAAETVTLIEEAQLKDRDEEFVEPSIEVVKKSKKGVSIGFFQPQPQKKPVEEETEEVEGVVAQVSISYHFHGIYCSATVSHVHVSDSNRSFIRPWPLWTNIFHARVSPATKLIKRWSLLKSPSRRIPVESFPALGAKTKKLFILMIGMTVPEFGLSG